MNMVAKFMVEHVGNCEFAETWYPQGPFWQPTENLIYIKFDPWGLPFPFPVIKAGYAGLEYPSPSGSCFAETVSPRLIGKTTQDDAVKPTDILVGNSSN